MKFALIIGLLNAVAILPELKRIVTDLKPNLVHSPHIQASPHTLHLPTVANEVHELNLPSFFQFKPKTPVKVPEKVERRGRFTITTYAPEQAEKSNAFSRLHTVKSPKSITRNHLLNSDLQGDVGACHIFATLEVLHDYTGLRLSKAKAFLVHLYSRLGPDQLTGVLELHLRHIAATQLDIAEGALKASCGNIKGWGGWKVCRKSGNVDANWWSSSK